jgi:two-component system cell cycle sensor histidine kinase/response regulator CckA
LNLMNRQGERRKGVALAVAYAAPAPGAAGWAGGDASWRLTDLLLPAVVLAAGAITVLAARRWRSRLDALRREVGEQKRIEEALQRSEERFRRFSEAAFEGILIHEGGLILDANQALGRMFGYRVEEMIGRSAFDFLTAESRALAESRINAEHEHPYELTGVHKSGSTFPIEVCGKTMLWEGKHLRVVAVRDISERKRLEEQLREAQKMEAVGRLAGGVAHDFNNLLTVIAGNAQWLAESLTEQDPRRAAVAEILEASHRAAALARRLLAFGRRQIIQPQVINLNDLVREMQVLLRRVIGEQIELSISLSPDLGNVKADPGQIEQVILNLVVNARDAMPEGGRLALSTANVECEQEGVGPEAETCRGRSVLLAVEDTGCGMDEATRQRIFEPYFTTKPLGRGAGLGLATVHGIVRQHGGVIRVESAPGQGTAFRVYLPRVDEPVFQPREGRAAGLPGGLETILLVEDEAGVRRLVRRSLEQLGYRVLEAGEPLAGLALCERTAGPIDLLVTDVIMPQMSGRQLAQQVRARRPAVKVLYLSGYDDEKIARAGVLEPGLHFLAKPFTLEALARKVREALES